MPQLHAYLTFNGNCTEAMRFYERMLAGKLEALITFGESPIAGDVPPENASRIMHAYLTFDGNVLMASDTMVGMPHEPMSGFSLSLTYPDVSDGERVFDTLVEGGRVVMPMQETFWAKRFGMLVDRFGTPWMINSGPVETRA